MLGMGSRPLGCVQDSTELAMLADLRFPSDMLDAALGSIVLDALDAAACSIAVAAACCCCCCCERASCASALLSWLLVEVKLLLTPPTPPVTEEGLAATKEQLPPPPKACPSAAGDSVAEPRDWQLRGLLGCCPGSIWVVANGWWVMPGLVLWTVGTSTDTVCTAGMPAAS